MSKIQTKMFRFQTPFFCLKSKLFVLRVWISDRKKYLKSEGFGSDFRHYSRSKLSGKGTKLNCLKSKLVQISDIHCMLPWKMFLQQNSLVDPKKVPLPIGHSLVTKFKKILRCQHSFIAGSCRPSTSCLSSSAKGVDGRERKQYWIRRCRSQWKRNTKVSFKQTNAKNVLLFCFFLRKQDQ